MTKQLSRADLETKIKSLEPYQEAFFCLTSTRPGEAERITIASGERSIVVIGIARAAGGVVIGIDDQTCGAYWLNDIIVRWSRIADPYMREIAGKAIVLQRRAIEARYAPVVTP